MMFRRKKNQAPRVEKPLLGFGWMGWVLLTIAGAITIFMLSDNPDLRVLHFINTLFGDGAEEWVNRRVFGSHRFNSVPPHGPLPIFGLWGLSVVLLGFQIHPLRTNPWWFVAFVFLAMMTPIAWSYIEFNSAFTSWSTSWKLGNRASYAFLFLNTIPFIVLVIATRSKAVLIGISALLIAYIICIQAFSTKSITFFALGGSRRGLEITVMRWLWNPLLLAILLSWAIPARIRYNRWWLCCKCRYDMRDIDTTTCPECGTVNERMPSPEAGAISADS